jgi:hypothetical protein
MLVYAMGSQVPTVSTVETQLEEAAEFRIEQLQTLHSHLTGNTTSTDDIEALREELTNALTDESLAADIDTVEDHYEQATFDRLRSVITQAEEATEPLAESVLADGSVRDEAETLANARTLLETTEDGTSLYEQLAEVETSLSESHEGFVTTQISRAVSGANIPDLDRARQLLAQGRHIQSGGEPEEGESELKQLWLEVADHDDGTIVVIDTEGAR